MLTEICQWLWFISMIRCSNFDGLMLKTVCPHRLVA